MFGIEVIKINVSQTRLRNFRWLSELHIFKLFLNPSLITAGHLFTLECK